MKTGRKRQFPLALLAIDFVGAVLVAWGLHLYISESSGVFIIAAGFLLMTPLIVYLLNFKSNSSNKMD